MGRLAWLAGGLAFAAGVLLRRRRRAPAGELDDARAADLRRKLDESRALLSERNEFEEAETPVDRAESVEERRARVHEDARATVDEMRRAEGADE